MTDDIRAKAIEAACAEFRRGETPSWRVMDEQDRDELRAAMSRAIDAYERAMLRPADGRLSWSYRHDCQGLFGEAFNSRARAAHEMAMARGGDASPDWRVVPVMIMEIAADTAEHFAAHAREYFRERAEVRARALSDLAAMDGEHL